MKAFLWSCLLCALIESWEASERPPLVLNAAVSAEVTFPVPIPDDFESGHTVWYFKESVVAIFEQPTYVTDRREQFEGRVSINGQTRSLQILDLRTEDSGEYEVFISLKSYPWLSNRIKYSFRIFNRVAAQVNITVNGPCDIILNCTEKDGNNVSVEWRKGQVKTSVEPILKVSLTANDSKLEACCEVQNPVSTSEQCIIPWEQTTQGYNHSNCNSLGDLDSSTSVFPYVRAAIILVAVAAGIVITIRC
ncbi:SLAM family member 5-like [Lissotriton helveticus]